MVGRKSRPVTGTSLTLPACRPEVVVTDGVLRVTGTVGAIDSGFVYYVEGTAIERLALDGAD